MATLQLTAEVCPVVVYLDQNKWIEIASEVKSRAVAHLVDILLEKIAGGRLVIPLTATNIFETSKINDTDRRRRLADIQSRLCRGIVFRGRHARLEVEVAQCLLSGQSEVDNSDYWFLSSNFIEAFADVTDSRFENSSFLRTDILIRESAGSALCSYLLDQDDERRRESVRRFSLGSKELAARVENRRTHSAGASILERRRLYRATLLIDEMNKVLKIANSLGLHCDSVLDIGKDNLIRLMKECPIYDIETELALKIESQNRKICENDFRDMQTYCCAIRYSDILVGERQFVNIARQAHLHEKYNCRMLTEITELGAAIETLSSKHAHALQAR